MTRVLVVEDSPSIARYVETALVLEDDLDVVLVMKGFKHLLDRDCPSWIDVDVICCDLMLPESSGWEILAVAKEHFPHVGRLLFTATPETALLQNEKLDLAQRIVGKGPITADELIAELRGLL